MKINFTSVKTWLKKLTYIILFINFACGQTMDEKTQKLLDNELLQQSQVKDFETLMNKSETKSNAKYLYALFQVEFKKLTGQFYSITTSFDFDEVDKLNATQQLQINKEHQTYLSKLRSRDLLTEKEFLYFQNKINNEDFFHKLQLMLSIIDKVSSNEHMNPDKLKLFVDELKSKQIITSNYDKLLTAIEQEKLQNPIDFLNYCDKAIIINENDFPAEPAQYLERMHQKTASIFPELAFTNFEFQIVLDSTISDADSKFYNFVVTLTSNGKKYKQKSSYHLYSPSKNKYFGNKIDQQEYYKIFNKILADFQSPYRLHEVKTYQGNAVDWKTFGIIALTKEQAASLQRSHDFLMPSYENFKNSLNTTKIEQAIEEYKKIGLLAHLSNEQIDNAKEKVALEENNTLNDVLMAFPDVIYSFDTELANLQDPYAELISAYKKIAHNDFNPTDIADNFNNNTTKKVKLKFKLGKKAYEKSFKIDSDWIDSDFFSFIDSVVKKEKLKGQFYQLYTGGQEASVIYLTTKQYNYLRTNKLLLFGDEEYAEEE